VYFSLVVHVSGKIGQVAINSLMVTVNSPGIMDLDLLALWTGGNMFN
jgi:hypothetical protein